MPRNSEKYAHSTDWHYQVAAMRLIADAMPDGDEKRRLIEKAIQLELAAKLKDALIPTHGTRT